MNTYKAYYDDGSEAVIMALNIADITDPNVFMVEPISSESITKEQSRGICCHCFEYKTVSYLANENGEPVTTPICVKCEEN